MHESFEQLYRGHRGDVYRAALRELGNVHDAEDVTQAAFVDAYRAVLRGTRPDAPRAWLLTIAENVRRRRFRTSMRRPREEPLDTDAGLPAEQSDEEVGALLEALGALTEEQRKAFLLREIAGLSYDEIAAKTGSTVGSVQMLLFRARKSLRDELEPPRVQPLLVPLTTFMSRFEGFRTAPRAAGAIGAAAVAIGVGAGAPAQADPQPTRPRASAPEPLAALVTRSPAAEPRAVRAAPARPARKAPAPLRMVKRTPPAPAHAAPAPAPKVVPAAQPVTPPAQPILPVPAVRAAPPEPAVAPLPELDLPTVKLPTLEAPPLPAVPVEATPLVDALVDGALESAGAAGAAGAGAPPLPGLPLDPVPPVP